MENKLRGLMTLLLGEETLSQSIYSDTDRINDVLRKYNNLLELNTGNVDGLKSTHISETVISPLPFYGAKNNGKYDIVCVSLTPAFNNTRIHLEKQAAGENWKQYFDFYTGNSYFDFVKEEHSSYFTNITKLLFALYEDHEEGQILIEDIEKKLEVEKPELLGKLLENKSILFPHIVPFHSVGFDTNMNGINHLRDNLPAYHAYVNELVSYIKENIKDNGIVMTNNFADSKVTSQLLKEDGAELIIENQLLSIMRWDNKLVVLFNDQPFTRFGLRSDIEIDTVMQHIKNMASDATVEADALDVYCKALLEEREAVDFKSRGSRIKGAQLKKLSVKNLRKK